MDSKIMKHLSLTSRKNNAIMRIFLVKNSKKKNDYRIIIRDMREYCSAIKSNQPDEIKRYYIDYVTRLLNKEQIIDFKKQVKKKSGMKSWNNLNGRIIGNLNIIIDSIKKVAIKWSNIGNKKNTRKIFVVDDDYVEYSYNYVNSEKFSDCQMDDSENSHNEDYENEEESESDEDYETEESESDEQIKISQNEKVHDLHFFCVDKMEIIDKDFQSKMLSLCDEVKKKNDSKKNINYLKEIKILCQKEYDEKIKFLNQTIYEEKNEIY